MVAAACLPWLVAALAASPASAATAHVFSFELNRFETPTKAFDDPCGVTVDDHGDVYVASAAIGNGTGTEGRIDVFGPDHKYITTVKDPFQPCGVAVDSEGNLYVHDLRYEGEGAKRAVVLYRPTVYQPESGQIAYGGGGQLIAKSTLDGDPEGVAVDPVTDRLYVAAVAFPNNKVRVFESAADGSAELEPITVESPNVKEANNEKLGRMSHLAVGGNGDIYLPMNVVTRLPEGGKPGGSYLRSTIIVIDGASHEFKREIPSSENCPLKIVLGAGVAVDRASGELYVGDVASHDAVYQFGPEGACLGRLEHSLQDANPFSDVAVDNSGGPNAGYVYVTSGATAASGRVFAFEPLPSEPPSVRGVGAAQITETEALLGAEINPHGHDTSYHFQYTPQADFEARGWEGAQSVPVPDGDAGAGGTFAVVSVPIGGLAPGETYRVRLIAASHCNPAEEAETCLTESEERTFSTYPRPPLLSACPNAALRIGASARLADCRAYELITPPGTNGRIPTATPFGQLGAKDGFAFPLAVGGDTPSLLFGTEGGELPGVPGEAGAGYYDAYRAVRGPQGWQLRGIGPSGSQASASFIGGASADHDYAFWRVAGGSHGSLETGAGYLRDAEGGFEEIGVGSLGADPTAVGRFIAPGARHVIFATCTDPGAKCRQLEPEAPPTGTGAVYDRLPDGSVKVLSLLPGDKTPAPGEDARYLGASADGSSVAFQIGEGALATIYLRRQDSETLEVASGAAFAGISRDGGRLFYLNGARPSERSGLNGVTEGELFAFDAQSGESTQIGEGGESIPVYISPDGSRAYFVSPRVLSGEEANGEGDKAQAGALNLYVWEAATGSVRFIATLTARDVGGEGTLTEGFFDGLGLWTQGFISPSRVSGPGNVPARSTPDGSVFVFESHANLSGYDPLGHSEIYRYDAADGSLLCLSCNPTGAPAESDARLQSRVGQLFAALPPVSAIAEVANLSEDGSMAFFQSDEALVASDRNRTTDVYEWEAKGVGGCERVAGCLSLISAGEGSVPSYLYAASPDGRDVFFLASGKLSGADTEGAPSLYDARVGGGFPQPVSHASCEGDGCQGNPSPPPALPGPASQPPGAPARRGGKGHLRCGAGKRKVRVHGRPRCVRRHKNRLPHRKHRAHRRSAR